MTMLARECQCGSKALKDGSRCAKCGKPLPTKRRPRPPMLDPPPQGAELTDGYDKLLQRLRMARET